MGLSPFAKKDTSPLAKSNSRRSSRIDYETPVILSGRDAAGKTFREETTTSIVNLHGAKIRTQNHVLVGMLVTVESVRTGIAGKAVCVRTYEAEAGKPYHQIAVQVVQPSNLWGVENPPADWAEVEAEMGGRAQPPQPTRATGIPFKPAAAPPTPPPPPAASPAAALVNRAPVEAQMADFEERAARMMDSVMETLRVQANVTVREFLANHEQRLAAAQSEAETRIAQRLEHATSELTETVETLHTDAMAEIVRETLLELQQRLDALSTEQETRLVERSRTVCAQAEERLAQAASKSLAQADSNMTMLDQRVRALTTDTENRIHQLAQQAASEKGPVFAAIQERAEALSARLESRVTQNTSKALTEFDNALATFRTRLGELAVKADAQFSERTDKAFADFEASLVSFRSDLEDELSARREETVQAVEQALRSRVAAMLSGMMGTPQDAHPVPVLNASRKK